MMREILFRGRRLDNCEWVEGYLTICDERYFILGIDKIQSLNFEFVPKGQYVFAPFVEVDPASVGQFTGLTDCGGAKLFEHDIITAKFKSNGARFSFEIIFEGGMILFDNGYVRVSFGLIRSVRKIGNIHDNPELLEG